jgi:hypothetical protein
LVETLEIICVVEDGFAHGLEDSHGLDAHSYGAISALGGGFFDQQDGEAHAGSSQRGTDATTARADDAEIIVRLFH